MADRSPVIAAMLDAAFAAGEGLKRDFANIAQLQVQHKQGLDDMFSEADLRAGRDVRGKLVLADPLPFLGVNDPSRQKFWSLLDLAAAGGVAGVVTDSGYAWRIPFNQVSVVRVPLLWVDSDEGAQARHMLAQPASLRADLHAKLPLTEP